MIETSEYPRMPARSAHRAIETGDKSDVAASGAPDQDARRALLRLVSGYRVSQVICVAAKLGIADLLRDGPRGSEELARATAAHAPSLYRVLRALAGIGVLEELDGRRFALAPLGVHLRSDVPGSVRSLATLFGQDPHWRAWGSLLHSVQTGERAFDRVYGQGLFEYLGQHPEAAALFNDTMIALTAEVAPAVAAAYDFSGVGTLVDVGGGRGHALVPILRANPTLRAVLFDLPHVVESARVLLADAGVGDRCDFVGGSFFESVPSGGDAYLLKHVIHDWDDERSLAILATCRRAMAASGRLLLVERDLPTDNRQALPALLSDLSMMLQLGGGERTVEEYRSLLTAAGFVVTRVIPTPHGESVIEAVPV
jgi:hypothetical protein